VALEIGGRNVTINSVAPGATHTPILAGVPDDIMASIRAGIPRGRIAEVDEIVPAYVFLASDDARHFQGQTLSPNGGDVFL
jgi:3-oxoacyl-[acyl-carrier protein] reductase